MGYLIGTLLAVSVAVYARLAGLDRERSFYPTVTVVVASYYGLFAVMGGSSAAIWEESVVIAGFMLVAAIGFRTNLWLIVVALAGHGVFDFFHGHIVSNPGVPAWWPMFCSAYDIAAAACLALLLLRSKIAARPS